MTSRVQGKQLLINLKSTATAVEPQLGLKVDTPDIAWLRPVATRREVQSEEDVHCLTEWRNKFVTSFLNEFEATESQTSDWLAEKVGPDHNRILFMIDDAEKQTIGYMGINFIDWESGYAEADSIVRGKNAAKGIMTASLKVMIAWGRGQLGLQSIGVRVRSDNPALLFYQRFGFVEQKRVPLSFRALQKELVWYEDPDNSSSTVSLVYHNFSG
jgi:RimJ/RimL family protein N-acetyltransferase